MTTTPATSVSWSWDGGFRRSVAEVASQPLTHVLDGLVCFGDASRPEDEGVLGLWQGVDLRGDFEVGKPMPERGVLAGEDLVVAVEEGRGWQSDQVGVQDADRGVGDVERGVLQSCRSEALEDRPAERDVLVGVVGDGRVLDGEVAPG